jgi:hypothetical protein
MGYGGRTTLVASIPFHLLHLEAEGDLQDGHGLDVATREPASLGRMLVASLQRERCMRRGCWEAVSTLPATVRDGCCKEQEMILVGGSDNQIISQYSGWRQR